MSVHSAQLYAGALTAGATNTVYTCPAGKRTIVKGITAFNGNAAASLQQLLVYSSGGTRLATYQIHLGANGAAGDSASLTPWLVINAGQTLRAYAQQTANDMSISGAELTL